MNSKIKLITPIVSCSDVQFLSIEKYLRSDLSVDHCSLTVGQICIEAACDDALSVPDLLKQVLQSEKLGFDAIVIDCMADPGLSACRELVSIPVIGTAQTAMHIASMLGRRFGYIGLLEGFRGEIEDLASTYGLSDRMSAYQAVDINVLDIADNESAIIERLTAAAIDLVKQYQVGAVVLGCTGFVNCANEMRQQLVNNNMNVQVVNHLPLAIHMADVLVKVGLSHSKLAYPTPAKKAVYGYPYFSSDEYLKDALVK